MKRKINSILYVSALTTMLLSSCQADFVDINRDHRQPTEKQLEQDNLNVGGFVTSFEKTIFPVGSSGTNYVIYPRRRMLDRLYGASTKQVGR